MFNKMKRINNKKCCMKLNDLLLFVLVCVWMWGCSELTDGEIEWSNNRDGAKVIGFVNDTFAIVSDWRSWSQEKGGIVNDAGIRNGRGHTRLRVYNYRVQKDGPQWSDSLDNDWYEYARGQLSDSIIWGSEKGSISFWKLGKKPRIIFYKEFYESCNNSFEIKRMRTWTENKIIVPGNLSVKGDSCQYAILDTNAKTLTYKRLEENLKWIEKCNDVRAWGESVYCLSWNKWNKDGEIKKDDVKINVHFDFGIGNFWGDMIELNGNFCKLHDEVLSCHDVTWHGTLEFYKDDEIIVKID